MKIFSPADIQVVSKGLNFIKQGINKVKLRMIFMIPGIKMFNN